MIVSLATRPHAGTPCCAPRSVRGLFAAVRKRLFSLYVPAATVIVSPPEESVIAAPMVQ